QKAVAAKGSGNEYVKDSRKFRAVPTPNVNDERQISLQNVVEGGNRAFGSSRKGSELRNQRSYMPQGASDHSSLTNSAWCREVFAKYSKTFYLGTLLLTRGRRKAI
ncbi:hypothetical protein FRX31_023725, partial [Thalictrum thalictroides]